MKKNASSSNLRARSSSSKESPAPFFSIFYRGMNKISRSQDRDHADRSGDSKTSPHMERKRMDTGEFDLKKRGKEEVASSKFAHKPPVPSASRITSGTKPLRTTATTSTNVETEVNKKRISRSLMELVPQQQQQSLPPNIQGPPPPYENDFEEAHVQQKNGSSFLSKKLHSLVSAPSSPTPSKKGRGVFSGIFGGKRTSTPAIDSYEVVNGTTRKSLAKPDTSPTLSFSQRVKLHKGIRTGQIPMEALKYTTRSHLALAEKPSSKKPRKKGFGGKATSMDTGMDELDTDQLAEALLAIGDEQPIVARSTPKHAVWTPDQQRRAKERQVKHCLFEKDVYEKMLSDSLEICDLLQVHLTDCIAGVRAKSPTVLSSPFTTPPGTPDLGRPVSTQPLYGGRPFSPPLFVRAPRVTIAVQSPSSGSAGLSHFPVLTRQQYVPATSMPQFPTR